MDVITYCADTEALKQELKDKGLYDAETNTYDNKMINTPIKKNGTKSLALVRGSIEEFDNIQVLGTYDDIFADPLLDAKYKSVYPYDVAIVYIDDEGVKRSYMRPKKIGEFA